MKHIEVVAAIIKHEGKYLATQRGYGDFKGQWEFPGGKIESGEAREEALVREIREELRMGIGVDRLLCTTEYDYPAFHLTMHCYLCHITEGTPQLTEHLAARWLSPEELHSVEWLPADVEAVDLIRREQLCCNENDDDNDDENGNNDEFVRQCMLNLAFAKNRTFTTDSLRFSRSLRKIFK